MARRRHGRGALDRAAPRSTAAAGRRGATARPRDRFADVVLETRRAHATGRPHEHVAVVTIAHGRHEHLARQHRSPARGHRGPDHYVVVAMDDPPSAALAPRRRPRPAVVAVGSRDPRRPAAGGRPQRRRAHRALDARRRRGRLPRRRLPRRARPRRGVRRRRRGAPRRRLVRAGHLPAATAAERLRPGRPGRPRRPAPGPPDPPARGACDSAQTPTCSGRCRSRCTARRLAARLGGFCEDYVGYGGEDTDFGARRSLAAAASAGSAGAARLPPAPPGRTTRRCEHLDDILRNGRLFHDRWGYWPMTGWLEEFERRGIVRRRNGHWERADLPS